MSKTKYVMVTFTDGDVRVYLKRLATKAVVRGWNKLRDKGHTDVTAEIVTESTDKAALIAMAKLARHDYVLGWEDAEGVHDETIVDRTAELEFP